MESFFKLVFLVTELRICAGLVIRKLENHPIPIQSFEEGMKSTLNKKDVFLKRLAAHALSMVELSSRDLSTYIVVVSNMEQREQQ